MDKPTGRVVALIVLLLAVAAALRGYLPAPHHGARAEAGGGQAALTFIVVALAVTLALLAVAIIARLRDPRAQAPHAGELSDMLGTGKGRPNWRVVLIGLALVAAWIVVVLLLSRFLGGHEIAPPPPTPDAPAPPSTHPAAPPPQQRPRHDSGDMLSILLVSTALMSLLIVAGAAAMARRRWRAAQPAKPAPTVDDDIESPAPTTRSESLVRAAERGLAEMTDLSRDPREAIIACYAAMERELANVPEAVPQDFDTPTEVLARAVEHHALQSDNAGQLVTLFAEARFSPHVMNEGHRDVAVRVLRMVLDELRSRTAA
jgi:hypothetical protein